MSIATMESPMPNVQFMWFAKFTDGTISAEFGDDNSQNEFLKIDKENLKEFGIMGNRAKLWFNTDDGIIKILNPNQTDPIKFEFALEDENQNLIKLSGRNDRYNDIIRFNRLAQYATPTKDGRMITEPPFVDQNNFGYKLPIEVKDRGIIYYSEIFKLNFNSPCVIECRIAPTFDFKGSLIITFNNKTFAPDPISVLAGKSITVAKGLLTNGNAR